MIVFRPESNRQGLAGAFSGFPDLEGIYDRSDFTS
jgi:hypothetical protein